MMVALTWNIWSFPEGRHVRSWKTSCTRCESARLPYMIPQPRWMEQHRLSVWEAGSPRSRCRGLVHLRLSPGLRGLKPPLLGTPGVLDWIHPNELISLWLKVMLSNTIRFEVLGVGTHHTMLRIRGSAHGNHRVGVQHRAKDILRCPFFLSNL